MSTPEQLDQLSDFEKAKVLNRQGTSFKGELGHVCQGCGSLFQDVIRRKEKCLASDTQSPNINAYSQSSLSLQTLGIQGLLRLLHY